MVSGCGASDLDVGEGSVEITDVVMTGRMEVVEGGSVLIAVWDRWGRNFDDR